MGQPALGLDTRYPYAYVNTPSYTNDNPSVTLPTTYLEVTRTFSANMYLMWQSGSPNSIPVPLGDVSWNFYGDAKQTNTTTHTWSLLSSPTNRGAIAFQSSTASQPSYGYPTWAGTSTESCH